MPAMSGWSSAIAPQPIRVGMTGTPSSSASSTSCAEAPALMMPPPATISGRSRCGEHVQCLFQLLAAGPRLLHGQGLVGVDVEFDLGQLHVDRQVQQHRARAAGAHQLEGLLEGAGNLAGFQDGHGHLGDRLGDGLDVHGLEVLLVQLGHGGLAGDAEHRDGIGPGRVQAGDHVRAGGARRCRCRCRCCRPWPGCSRRPCGWRLQRGGPGCGGCRRGSAWPSRTG